MVIYILLEPGILPCTSSRPVDCPLLIPRYSIFLLVTRQVDHLSPADCRSLYLQGPVAISIRNVWVRCPLQMHLTELSINAAAANILLQSISMHPNFFSSHAPLHNVLRLTLNGVDTALAARFIDLMPAITHLTIVPSFTRAVATGSPTAQITMPNLVHLSLVPSPHDRFYGAIVAPQLSVLELDPGPLDMVLLRFRRHISRITTLSLSGRINRVDLTFCNFIDTASLTVLRLDLPPSGDSDHPREILALMHQHPAVLPNVWDLQTNAVWSRPALEMLRTLHPLRQPRLTLTIFIVCPSEDHPIPGKERIRHLCEMQIVRVIRQFRRWP